MKKKIIFGMTLLILIGSIFSYENRDFFNKIKLNQAGITLYGSGKYESSELIFSGAQVKGLDAILEYNKANSLYKQGENTSNMKEKINYFQKALESYSGSFNLENNSDTRDNIIFIENILEKLSKPEESKNDETSNDLDQNGESSENNKGEENQSGEKGEEQDKSDSGDNKKSGESGNESEGQDKNQSSEPGEGAERQKSENELSDEQIQQIEKYSDQLKQSEFYNQKYFNKKPQEINRDINDLFSDPFFDDSFERGGEKDW